MPKAKAPAAPKLPEVVIYVDSIGKKHAAQRLTEPAEDGRSKLFVSFGGAARLNHVNARYSADGEPGTWHRPPKPS